MICFAVLDSLRRMRPVIHKMSTGGEDKWYERDNRFRYAHLLNDPILDTVGDIGEEEGEGDLEGLRKEPTSLSDFYDIRSRELILKYCSPHVKKTAAVLTK